MKEENLKKETILLQQNDINCEEMSYIHERDNVRFMEPENKHILNNSKLNFDHENNINGLNKEHCAEVL